MTHPRHTPTAVIAVGAIAAAVLVGRAAGLGVTVVAIALLAVTVRPREAWAITFWLMAAALAAVATMRAAGWIVWPSLVAAGALGSLAAARWARVSRLLLGALCALTLVVLASALTRLDLYMDAYGLTRLRLSAQAAILWLGGVFALILIAGAARRMGWLPRATVALTAAAILGFAISNPDRRIAEHNVERSGPVDERVLRGLSADAAPPCRAGSKRRSSRTA